MMGAGSQCWRQISLLLALLFVISGMIIGLDKKNTVKPVLSGHLKIDKTKILMTDTSLMKVQSVAECSPWSILQYF